MRSIYKYPLKEENSIITGQFEAFLKLDYQYKVPTVWAIVNDELVESSYQITTKGTGWDLEDKETFKSYIGTLIDDVGFVWHYFCTRCDNQKTNPNDMNEEERMTYIKAIVSEMQKNAPAYLR